MSHRNHDPNGLAERPGEMVLPAGEPSTFTGALEETATVLRIEAAAINQLVPNLPRFALEISQFIADRRKLTRA